MGGREFVGFDAIMNNRNFVGIDGIFINYDVFGVLTNRDDPIGSC